MIQFKDAWEDHQRKRFMRPDAARYMRPDAYRYMRPDAYRFATPNGTRGYVAVSPKFYEERYARAYGTPSA